MSAPSISVVIVTLDRAESLRRTLASLRYQRYPEFEVVVVNGPSADHTEAVLQSFPEVVACSCPVANLSRARNIGLAAARGEFVAFVDDDALPEFGWLDEMMAGFDHPSVCAVGGLVLDHTGMAYQYKFSAVSRLGRTTHRNDEPFDDQCFPGSFCVPYIQGTNAMFRAIALRAAGGFDETYEYFHDETDLCLRLSNDGWRIRQLSSGVVHHKSAPSEMRSQDRAVTNLFPIVKNTAYFACRHAAGYRSGAEILASLDSYAAHWVDDLRRNAAAGRIDATLGETAATTAAAALATGMAAAADGPRLGAFDPPGTAPIRPFNAVMPSCARRLVVIAPDLATFVASPPADDAELRVLVPAASISTVELEHGVWVHRLHGADFAAAVAEELRRLAEWDAAYEVAVHRGLGDDFIDRLSATDLGAGATQDQSGTSAGPWRLAGRLPHR